MRRIVSMLFLAAAVVGAGPPSSASPTAKPANASHPASRKTPDQVFTDFNGDGFADLAIGVPYEDVGSIVDAGVVQVLYGTDPGLQADVPDDQIWGQDTAGVRDLAEAYDYFGWSVAGADFNGDGYGDLAIGVYGEGIGTVTDAGAVAVLYGSAAGLQANAPDDQLWSQDSPGVLDTSEAYDYFGYSLAPGDFNGDGYADVAVGVPYEDGPTVSDAGAVAVLYGSDFGIQVSSPEDQIWTQDSPGVQDQAEQSDLFGFSLTSGPLNGGVFDDLAIGVPYEDPPLKTNPGAVAVLYGSSGGLQASAPDDQLWTQDSPGVLDEGEDADFFGYSLSAGDFNADGYGDLVIGVPYEDVGTVTNAGAVAVLYGSPGGIQVDSPDDQLWSQDSPGVRDASEFYDYFGWASATGDFNGDGYFDLAVGVPLEDVGTITEAGAVAVLYGSGFGIQVGSPDDQLWTQDSPGVRDLSEGGDYFGWTLTSGRYNGDQGYADLAIGVVYEDVGTVFDAGAVAVFYGSDFGIQVGSPDDQIWGQDTVGVRDSGEPSDLFGRSLG